MLIDPQGNKLGDSTHLKDRDDLDRLKEMNRVATEKRKLPNQDFLSIKEAGKGRSIEPTDFVLTLNRLNPNLLIKSSYVYLPRMIAARPTLAIYKLDPEEEKGIKYVTGFFVDKPLPEWTTYEDIDQHGVARRMERGWREVLVILIKQGLVSVVDANERLGHATGARAHESWWKQIQNR